MLLTRLPIWSQGTLRSPSCLSIFPPLMESRAASSAKVDLSPSLLKAPFPYWRSNIYNFSMDHLFSLLSDSSHVPSQIVWQSTWARSRPTEVDPHRNRLSRLHVCCFFALHPAFLKFLLLTPFNFDSFCLRPWNLSFTKRLIASCSTLKFFFIRICFLLFSIWKNTNLLFSSQIWSEKWPGKI